MAASPKKKTPLLKSLKIPQLWRLRGKEIGGTDGTNSFISKFPEKNPNIRYTDIGHIYLDTEGKVRQELMPDYLHPNVESHLLMFEALEDVIAKLMVE